MTTLLSNRIAELKNIQQHELENNFKNDDLWNECEDAIYRINKHGQEEKLISLFDDEGNEAGYELNDNSKVYFSGVNFENQD